MLLTTAYFENMQHTVHINLMPCGAVDYRLLERFCKSFAPHSLRKLAHAINIDYLRFKN